MKDRFSANANQYAQFRPKYPPALYEFIYQHVQYFEVAWDCGTGNGQAARDLSKKFKKVFATDLSTKQIENAYQAENIFYSIANEKSSFSDNSVDLITVAQAGIGLTWKFFQRKLNGFQNQTVWLPCGDMVCSTFIRKLICSSIISILRLLALFGIKKGDTSMSIMETYIFLFRKFDRQFLQFRFSWTLAQLEGYLTTWSAVQKYIAVHTQSPVDKLISQIKIHWKDERQTVNFPLFLKLGRVIK